MTGANELAKVGKALKAAGDGDLRKELLAGIRGEVKKMIPDVQASARSSLPKSGGLADRVASQKWAARSSLASGKVSLVGSGMKALRDIDAGRLRHPVFGNRSTWVQQRVAPGFFTKPLEDNLPAVRTEIEKVMRGIAARVERQA